MKAIKAYVHRSRVSDVIEALKASASWACGQHNLTLYLVKGSHRPLDDAERQYSVDLGEEVVNEYKLELNCDEPHVAELIAIIRKAAATGQPNAGWIYVSDVLQAIPIV